MAGVNRGSHAVSRIFVRKMIRPANRLLPAAFALTLATAPVAPEEFYQQRLRIGEDAYAGKQFAEAADSLRIATFGLLDQPPALTEGLVFLALAQQAAGRAADVDATLARFLDVERGFATFVKARISPEARAEFEQLLIKRVPPEKLLALPALTHLVETAEQKLAKLPPKEREKSLEELMRKEPKNVAWPLWLAQDAAVRGEPKAVVRWSTAVLALDPQNMDALGLRGHALTLRKSCPEALADLKALPAARLSANSELLADSFVCFTATKDWSSARAIAEKIADDQKARKDVAAALKKLASQPAATSDTASSDPPASAPGTAPSTQAVAPAPTPTPKPSDVNLAQLTATARDLAANGRAGDALKMLLAALDQGAESRDLRKAVLEAACLSKSWSTAASQAVVIQPFKDDEAIPMFYAAVALFETGDVNGARSLMSRARPKVAKSPYVDYYAKRILGGS